MIRGAQTNNYKLNSAIGFNMNLYNHKIGRSNTFFLWKKNKKLFYIHEPVHSSKRSYIFNSGIIDMKNKPAYFTMYITPGFNHVVKAASVLKLCRWERDWSWRLLTIRYWEKTAVYYNFDVIFKYMPTEYNYAFITLP